MPNGMLGDNVALHEFVCGPLTDLFEKINGRDGEEWLTALKRFLRKEKVVWPTFRMWRTIRPLHSQPSRIWYRSRLEEEGIFVAAGADFLLRRANFTWEIAPVKLVKVTALQLGFIQTATREEIYARAQLFGLGLCGKDAGPLLRLQYLAQPLGEELIVASEPLFDEDPKSQGLFEVGCSSNPNLKTALSWADGRPEAAYAPGSIWVFAWR